MVRSSWTGWRSRHGNMPPLTIVWRSHTLSVTERVWLRQTSHAQCLTGHGSFGRFCSIDTSCSIEFCDVSQTVLKEAAEMARVVRIVLVVPVLDLISTLTGFYLEKYFRGGGGELGLRAVLATPRGGCGRGMYPLPREARKLSPF